MSCAICRHDLDNILKYYVGEDVDSILSIMPNYLSTSNFQKGQFIVQLLQEKKHQQTVHKEYNTAIEKFLRVYQEYSEIEEDAEFIVVYPEAVADESYQRSELAQEVFLPIVQYWDDIIIPAMSLYNDMHDISTQCDNIFIAE